MKLVGNGQTDRQTDRQTWWPIEAPSRSLKMSLTLTEVNTLSVGEVKCCLILLWIKMAKLLLRVEVQPTFTAYLLVQNWFQQITPSVTHFWKGNWMNFKKSTTLGKWGIYFYLILINYDYELCSNEFCTNDWIRLDSSKFNN